MRKDSIACCPVGQRSKVGPGAPYKRTCKRYRVRACTVTETGWSSFVFHSPSCSGVYRHPCVRALLSAWSPGNVHIWSGFDNRECWMRENLGCSGSERARDKINKRNANLQYTTLQSCRWGASRAGERGAWRARQRTRCGRAS